MDWIALCYSLPSKEGSSRRVTLWRRLRRLGALTIAGGVHILPARNECAESFQWLAQEVRASNGLAAVIRVSEIEGLTDQQLVALFCAARAQDYREIENRAQNLKQAAGDEKEKDTLQARDGLARLRRRYSDIARIDYFECPERKRVVPLLGALEQTLTLPEPANPPIPRADVSQYRDKRWVTRPHPYVDRLACAWLIRRFINSLATIRYLNGPEKDETPFDMDEGEFGHRGNLCTFEVMALAFGLNDEAVQVIAEIVHEIDLHDDRYARPEIAGVESLLTGWSLAGLSDNDLELKGISLFEGLYVSLSRDSDKRKDRQEVKLTL